MKVLFVSGHKDAQKAQEKRLELEARGMTVTVYGPGKVTTIDSQGLDDGCIATGDDAW